MNKIILIDDNKSNQREIYGASFVDKDEYADCLIHKEELNEDSDFTFLNDAACILLHDSLADYVDGHYVSSGRMAKEIVMEQIHKQNIPYVLFSDGHSVIGEWSQDKPNVVRSIKKSEFYRNLRAFLDSYRESGKIDLRLIAFGNEYEKKEIVYLLQQLFDKLKNNKENDIITSSLVEISIIERFFDKVKHVSTSTFQNLYQNIEEGKLSVGRFKAYINILASRAIRYTSKSTKQNILLLGNEDSKNRLSNLANVTFKSLSTFQLGERGEVEMFDNIFTDIPADTDAIIIDVDSTKSPDACLSYALAIRLSLQEKMKAALSPIIFMSSLTSDIFKNSPYSSILQTKGISFETPLYTPIAVDLIEPLKPKDYRPYFLDLIKVKPNSTEGRHSIANQWGADVLSRVVLGTDTDNELIKRARKSLYFKYVLALTLTEETITSLSSGEKTEEYTDRIPSIEASGKRVLLIDDEADKGWSDVLAQMLSGCSFKTIKEHAADFEELSEDAKTEITSGNYDLIFLDLRMNGSQEEGKLRPEDFSGMKILKSIKKINKGTQVIMFTASNKAWNMKALMDAGADGYYIKESPEYAFSRNYSLSNTKSFYNNIKKCLNRSYLKDIARKIKVYKTDLTDSDYDINFKNRISVQLDVAYTLISTAITQQQFAFAYISLEQILEIISEELIVSDNYHLIIDSTQEECNDWTLYAGQCRPVINHNWNDYPQWKKICSLYYQLWNGKDASFGEEIHFLIEKRNAFMHNDKVKLRKPDIHNKKINLYSEDGFLRLFKAISEILACALK